MAKGRRGFTYAVSTSARFGAVRALATGAVRGVTVAAAGDRVVATGLARRTVRIAELR